jgi:hypothetical protein
LTKSRQRLELTDPPGGSVPLGRLAAEPTVQRPIAVATDAAASQAPLGLGLLEYLRDRRARKNVVAALTRLGFNEHGEKNVEAVNRSRAVSSMY